MEIYLVQINIYKNIFCRLWGIITVAIEIR